MGTYAGHARLIAMNKVKGGQVRLVSDEPSRQAPNYAAMGLDEASLRRLLIDEADRRVGDTIGVAFPGRGAVLWHQGRISFLGPAGERGRELSDAVEALIEGVDIGSGMAVRDLLLTMSGARLVVHRLVVGERGDATGQ
jgi:hypothetical protein